MARSRKWQNCSAAILFIIALQVSSSVQKRNRDSNNLVLEIAEAGQVKQFPVIQPALDAISDFWSSIVGSNAKPAAPTKATTPKTVVKPIKVGVTKPAMVVVKPASVLPMANTLMAAKPVDIKPLNHVKPFKSRKGKSTTTTMKTTTTKKALPLMTLKKQLITVTPKGISSFPLKTNRTTSATPLKITTTESTTTPEATILTLSSAATSSILRSSDDDTENVSVPMIYVQRLQDLLVQLQLYNEELSNLRLEINN